LHFEKSQNVRSELRDFHKSDEKVLMVGKLTLRDCCGFMPESWSKIDAVYLDFGPLGQYFLAVRAFLPNELRALVAAPL